MGSSDRRMTSRYCYNYFRLGNAFPTLPVVNRLALAEFLCETESAVLPIYYPELNDSIAFSVEQKVQILERTFGEFLPQVFPLLHEISSDIDVYAFITNYFVQPYLFLRVKREETNTVMSRLEKEQVPFSHDGFTTLTLPNGQALQHVRGLDGRYEVQDLSSQRTGAFFDVEAGQSWWDCCAASGGKSLLLLDMCDDIQLMVSDIRISILRNLEERFEKAKVVVPYRKKILDLSQSVAHLMKGESFDRILLDAPCSGSGTWGRTPEMIRQFPEKNIGNFAQLQKRIATNVVPYLKKGGQLLYITCSVFAAENDQVADYIKKELGLVLQQREVLKGYEQKADSMYVATFRKD